MTTVGVVSPGAMGSALGRAWRDAGADVVATVAGRSPRTHGLADGLRLLPDLDAVVATSDIVVSVCPPAAAESVLGSLLAAAGRTRTTPLIADLNAVAPTLIASLAERSRAAGLDLVDGSISGSPPRPEGTTTLYLSGWRAEEVATLGGAGTRPVVVGPDPGLASAVKMCTASVYKGTTALWAQALETAAHFGVLEPVLADLAEEFPGTAEHAGRLIALATSKSGRFVGEMEQIAATQGEAGVSPELFAALAAVYRRLSATPLARLSPEEARELRDLDEVLRRLRGEA